MASNLILVIDDEIETIDLLRAALSRRGYEVVGLTDGERGLEYIRDRKPALLLLDLMMPRVSGYDICRELRADPQTADLPIIVLSASGTMLAETNALAAGANQFVLKPVSIKTLTSLIESALQSNT
jgi:CheY-like chemotaxis protein